MVVSDLPTAIVNPIRKGQRNPILGSKLTAPARQCPTMAQAFGQLPEGKALKTRLDGIVTMTCNFVSGENAANQRHIAVRMALKLSAVMWIS